MKRENDKKSLLFTSRGNAFSFMWIISDVWDKSK